MKVPDYKHPESRAMFELIRSMPSGSYFNLRELETRGARSPRWGHVVVDALGAGLIRHAFVVRYVGRERNRELVMWCRL